MTFERCDSHHHLYAGANAHFAGSQYLVAELAADAATAPTVTSSVYVQAHNAYDASAAPAFAPVGETSWVAGLNRPDNLINKIIGFADLSLGGDIEPVLQAHIAVGDGRFAGIRHSAAWDADPSIPNAGCAPPQHLLLRPEVSAALAVVHRMGLTYETWIYQPQLGEFASLARRHPDGVLILDHLGGPLDTGAQRADSLREWRHGLVELARCPNVIMKLGGLGIAALTAPGRIDHSPDADELAAHWGPEISWVIETFGADRCMFETNFPVDLRLCGYAAMWNTFDLITESLSPDEKAWLFHRTAETAYGIG